MEYVEKKFSIGELKGISKKQIDEHLKLYAGYVKHANLINQKVAELKTDAEKNSYAITEITRRFGFEFNGMRNHEVYFGLLENGGKQINAGGNLAKSIESEWGSFENWLSSFKATAMTRGVGWAMLYKDPVSGRLINAWIDEQHLGQLQGCKLIVALDMWEHSYLLDYTPGDKKKYVDAFFENLNWDVAEKNF
ncbi:MAG: superoxide dismutase [Chitinophagaceae bacterium]|nr:superoxide dismutase [Chitinophagaceae bacterium]